MQHRLARSGGNRITLEFSCGEAVSCNDELERTGSDELSKYTTTELIAEIRRQAATPHPTWPCLHLRDLLPMCDEFERVSQSRDFYQRRCEALQAV